MRAADQLIAISQSTRSDILRTIPTIPPEKISVIYPYAAPQFRPLAPTAARATAQRYGLPERFLLFVGTLERRKNLVNLLEAFAQARRGPAAPHALVLVGARGWLSADIFAAIERLDLGRGVILPGYVAEADLPALYAAAEVCVLLSRYEGFGYPLLEAMACGTPTLAARAGSLPEVVGEAGVLVDPHDVAAVAAAIAELVSDADRRADLAARGLIQARRFSAERFCRETLAVYRQVVGARDAARD
jgi:glycosyltransferase involved in cell wall biosynthesis